MKVVSYNPSENVSDDAVFKVLTFARRFDTFFAISLSPHSFLGFLFHLRGVININQLNFLMKLVKNVAKKLTGIGLNMIWIEHL